MDSVYNRYPAEEFSYFEHNLEVWRQLYVIVSACSNIQYDELTPHDSTWSFLRSSQTNMELQYLNMLIRWRVLEISDIIMIIVDVRHPVIHFPPSLYQYVVKEMNRKLVVVFNKVMKRIRKKA